MASKLDVPFVNFWLHGPVEPFATSLYRRSNRNAFAPNPVAYFPQKETGIETQYMVRVTFVSLPHDRLSLQLIMSLSAMHTRQFSEMLPVLSLSLAYMAASEDRWAS